MIDDVTRRAYTNGQCHALSIAVQERTGWPIRLIVPVATLGTEDPQHLLRRVRKSWLHAANLMPDGRLLDITGSSTQEELLSAWGIGLALFDPPENFTETLHVDHSGVEPDMEVAHHYAELTLLRHRPTPEHVSS